MACLLINDDATQPGQNGPAPRPDPELGVRGRGGRRADGERCTLGRRAYCDSAGCLWLRRSVYDVQEERSRRPGATTVTRAPWNRSSRFGSCRATPSESVKISLAAGPSTLQRRRDEPQRQRDGVTI